MKPKSQKIIFVGYSKDIKGYGILKSNSIEVIIIRDVKFDENILAYKPNSTYVPSSNYETDLIYVPSSSSSLDNTPYLVTYLDDDNSD